MFVNYNLMLFLEFMQKLF